MMEPLKVDGTAIKAVDLEVPVKFTVNRVGGEGVPSDCVLLASTCV